MRQVHSSGHSRTGTHQAALGFKRLPNNFQATSPLSGEASLNYPEAWVVPLSPLAREMEYRAEAWLREREIIHDPAGAEKFHKLAVGEYANWPFPCSDPKKAEVITKFLALWIFYDDVIEEADDGQQGLILQAIRGDPKAFREGNAHLRCWWELGQAYSQVMSRTWLHRHGRRFLEWVHSVREECFAANQFRETGIHPSAAQHLLRRRMNIGMIPNIDFIEYKMGWELPKELLADPDMKRLEILSAEVVALINDIFGFGKDKKLNWCNLVPCFVQEFGVSIEEAFHWVCDLHNARVREITLLEPALIRRSPDRAALAEWLRGLHHIMYGFARWHAMAPRYSSDHDVGDGRRLRVSVREISPHLSRGIPKASYFGLSDSGLCSSGGFGVGK
jgi:terpene synthase-like protein